ncbi:RNA polymerase sigma factor [Erythrobacter sp. W53]|uniref:RNA polymerase sigma factor n=1 Tax=Erythrobacter sp. W53 TaxID=3425947 RepID=UPI003D76811D
MTLAATIADARPRVIAALAAHFRDLDLAEDAFSDAVEALLKLDEMPDRVNAWLYVSAKRKALDRIRRQQTETRALATETPDSDMADILEFPDPIPDERLRLLFICCHPALAVETRAALALRIVCGVPVEDIARTFLVKEASMFQRITRAKAKIHRSGVPFETPPRKDWPERIEAILLALELAYTLAYQDSAGETEHAELGEEVERLGAMLAELCPENGEVLGFAALVTLATSRVNARVDADGVMVPLSRQDPQKWDGTRIERARRWLEKASALGATGPYQAMAAIQLTHARRYFGSPVDWPAIATLYQALLKMRKSRIVAINCAVALGHVEGAEVGLSYLRSLPSDGLEAYRPYYAAMAHLYAEQGDTDDARSAFDKALACGPAEAERRYLEQQRAALG